MGGSESKSADGKKIKPTDQVPFGADNLKPKGYSTNDRSKHGVPIYCNVYNLQDTTAGGTKPKGGQTFNQAMGFGVFHSGVEILGAEWSFGGHPEAGPSMNGIFPVFPKSAMPQHQFHKQIRLGEIVGLTQEKLGKILRKIEGEWKAMSYHLLNHNCNHFGVALLKELSQEFKVEPPLEQPSWVNRAARFGDVMVPERIYKAMMRRAPQPPQGNGASNYSSNSAPPRPQQHNSSSTAPGGSGKEKEPEEEVPKIPLSNSRDDMKKMSVREIKTMMWVNGVSWEGCFEKDDLIDAVLKYQEG